MSKASSRKKVLAVCAEHTGGIKDIPFMMRADDFRLSDPRFSDNYTVIDPNPTYIHKERRLVTSRGTYQVFPDWSLRLLS